MREHRINMVWRDKCADKLVPLNKCRRASLFMPWACADERLEYEKCEYLEYKKRVALAKEARSA